MSQWIEDAAAEIAKYGPLCTVADIKRVIRKHYGEGCCDVTELAVVDEAVSLAQETLFVGGHISAPLELVKGMNIN